MRIEVDVCAGRHGGNAHSAAAHELVAPYKGKMRERVRVHVVACGHEGVTLKELAERFDKLPHQISGRFSELKAEGQVFDSGRERDGYTVYVGRREWVNGGAEKAGYVPV